MNTHTYTRTHRLLYMSGMWSIYPEADSVIARFDFARMNQDQEMKMMMKEAPLVAHMVTTGRLTILHLVK